MLSNSQMNGRGTRDPRRHEGSTAMDEGSPFKSPQGSCDVNSDEESEHYFKIVRAFKSYRGYSQSVVLKRLNYLESLPSHQQTTLKDYKAALVKVLNCIEMNHRVLEMITEDEKTIFENLQHQRNASGAPPKTSGADIDKVQTTLKQIYREWSREGVLERIQSYQPIIDELEEHFPTKNSWRQRENVNVLVPGAGLGRLAFEIAKLGFSCQGCEFSMYMLFASNFILNKCSGVDLYTIYPWTASVDNNVRSMDMAHPVTFPDTDPTDLLTSSNKPRFTMAAGDFLEIYTEPNEWDCIVTCFFIDCAPNIYTFIEQIHRILKPGGLWVTLGPLQYHFSTSNDEMSIEPSFEDVKQIIKAVGFEILKEEARIPTLYCQNRSSLLKQHYDSVFMSCKKINGNQH